MSDRLENYLHELRRELRRRGVFASRVVEEVRDHVLDAAVEEERRGVPSEAAVDHALERFGPARALAIGVATDTSLILERVLLLAGVGLGLLLGYVDSRPTWDDTGVTAGVLLLGTAILGVLAPQRPWVWALCMGLWIPLLGIVGSANYGSLIALVVAFAGAYGGMLIRRVVIPT